MSDDKLLKSEAKMPDKIECIICKRFIEKNKTFTCSKCRRSSMCLEHFDEEYKVCPGCATEKRINLYNNLLKQARSLKGFLRLSQFIFLVFAIIFTSNKLFLDYIPEYIRGNIFFENSLLWGVLSGIGVVLFFIFRSSQKSRLTEINNKIQEYGRYPKFSRY